MKKRVVIIRLATLLWLRNVISTKTLVPLDHVIQII
jgi:hypothetical protein